MTFESYRAPNEDSSGDMSARARYAKGIHTGNLNEKRGSVGEVKKQLVEIMDILPEKIKLDVARQAGMVQQDPGAAIDIMTHAIEENEEEINRLDNRITADEALQKLEKLRNSLTGGTETVQ